MLTLSAFEQKVPATGKEIFRQGLCSGTSAEASDGHTKLEYCITSRPEICGPLSPFAARFELCTVEEEEDKGGKSNSSRP